MTQRRGLRQSDAMKLIKAAVVAGFRRPRLLLQPDGTLLLECDPGTPLEEPTSTKRKSALRNFDELLDG
jgi:hypothetical protein